MSIKRRMSGTIGIIWRNLVAVTAYLEAKAG